MKFEYKILRAEGEAADAVHLSGSRGFQQQLNELGQDGWELVHMDTSESVDQWIATLKRPLRVKTILTESE